MTITTSAVQLTESGSTVYVLHWGEYEDKTTSGPFLGATGLDFNALVEDYRRDRYAAAEAAKEDYCSLDEGNFSRWLVAKGIFSPIETTDIHVEIRTSYDNAYVPKHWPECPECGEGRGEQEYGEVRRSLNRIMAFRRCTEYRHEWAHVEVPNNSRLPMLDDDGRDTLGGCVPFAISKACGIDFAQVLKVCEKHGWSRSGMAQSKAVIAARELGFELVWQSRSGIGTSNAPTLKRLIAELPHDRNYVVGVKDHWLALVGGLIVDNDTSSGPARKVLELYEVKNAQAFAA